jgi:hypothetical protein
MERSNHWLEIIMVLTAMATLACTCSGTSLPFVGGASAPTSAPGSGGIVVTPTKPSSAPTQAPSTGGAAATVTSAPAGSGGGGNTALAAYKLALPLATQWKSDAVLLEIQTAPPAPLAADGSIKPLMWMVNFYSPSAGATNNVMVQGGKATLGNRAANKMTDDRSVPDPASLMDSDRAVSIAEQNGGADARKQGATQAQVSLIHHALGDIRWIVNYMGADIKLMYAVQIDAKTGKVLFKGK